MRAGWHGNGNVYVINYWQRGIVLIKRAWDEKGTLIKVEGWNDDGTPEAGFRTSRNWGLPLLISLRELPVRFSFALCG